MIRLVELIDRRFALCVNASDEQLLLEGVNCVAWLFTDPALLPYTRMVQAQSLEQDQRYQERWQPLVERAIELKNTLLELYPNLDDRQAAYGPIPISYIYSFKRFEDLERGQDEMDNTVPFEIGAAPEDKSILGRMLTILGPKFNTVVVPIQDRGETVPSVVMELLLERADIQQRHEHIYRSQLLEARVSPGAALAWWFANWHGLNPEPIEGATSLHEMYQAWTMVGPIVQEAREFVFADGANPYKNEMLRQTLRRIHEEFRALIGTSLTHRELIGRYKARSSWYDKKRLRALVLDNGKFIRDREDTLVLDLARWLFDQGLPVLVTPSLSNLKPDLLGFGPSPLVVEGKAYKQADGNILKNLAQLHAYLTSLDSSNLHVNEAYYVVFRLGGPIYEFPEVVETQRYRIYPMLIDLGLSSDSGRRQPAAQIISVSDVLQAFDPTGTAP